jgi:hypothetical protein
MLGGLKTEVVFRLLGVIVCLNGSLFPGFWRLRHLQGYAVNDAANPLPAPRYALYQDAAVAVHAYDNALHTTVSDEWGTFSFDVKPIRATDMVLVAKNGELALGS